MDAKYVREAAVSFSASRARQLTAALWERARLMDTPAVWRAAEAAADYLRAAGIENVQIGSVPADGQTTVGGWVMPVAWEVKQARLESAGPGGGVLFADYASDPQSIAVYSPPTAGWVDGEVIRVSAAEGKPVDDPVVVVRGAARSLAGRFLLLPPDMATFGVNEYAARAGALGIITSHPGPVRNASRFLNYAVPLAAGRPCVPVFSLSLRNGESLGCWLDAGGRRLRARVSARRYAGSMPMLTGSLGAGRPAIYLCGHIDEIGAQDNASGCAVGLEILRVMRRIQNRPGIPPQRRRIEFFFSSEVRGMQWWFNHKTTPSLFHGGLNLDMVGRPSQDGEVMQLMAGFKHRPHFAGRLLLGSARLADRLAGAMPFKTRFNFVSDGVPGLHAPGGHLSIEQKTGPTYHSSADKPPSLDSRTLRWTGMAATSLVYQLTRLSNADVLGLARQMDRELAALDASDDPDKKLKMSRGIAEIQSLRKAIEQPGVYREYTGPEEIYRAGVSRRTGCGPEVRIKAGIENIVAAWTKRKMSTVNRAGEIMVPEALFKGFLSFEDRFCSGAAELRRKTGLKPGWGTESWAWILASCFTGRETLDDILSDLGSLGVAIDREKAVNLVNYLTKQALVRLRPILELGDIRLAAMKAGVRRGAVLVVHSSLSRFGYVRGGAATVVAALREALGPDGTLIMPTHSYSVLGLPPYDPAASRSGTGSVTEYFRKLPGVVRSAHPTHSVAGLGPRAAEIVVHRPDQAPMARDGFWGRLYDADGDVLLMSPLNTATIFHAGETWLDLLPHPLVAHTRDSRGRRRVHVLPNAPWHANHFEDMAKDLMRRGMMTKTKLGDNFIYFASARAMADKSVRQLLKTPRMLLPRNGTCMCPTCRALKAKLEE